MSNIQVMISRGKNEKFKETAHLLQNCLTGSVLDLGCDARFLSKWNDGHYVGIGISGGADIEANVEYGLPLPSQSFDTVIALDILKDCDRLHFVFDELCRVSRSHVIVGLPNMYEWRFRLRFVLGKEISGKYGLPPENPAKRNRWFFDIEDARSFVRIRGARQGFTVENEIFDYYGFRHPLPRLMTAMGKVFAPRLARLFAYHYSVVLRRDEASGTIDLSQVPVDYEQ